MQSHRSLSSQNAVETRRHTHTQLPRQNRAFAIQRMLSQRFGGGLGGPWMLWLVTPTLLSLGSGCSGNSV